MDLDFSQNMLKCRERKSKRIKSKSSRIIHGNAMELPFPDNTFDYVTIGFGLRNVPDYHASIKRNESSSKTRWKSSLLRNISTRH